MDPVWHSRYPSVFRAWPGCQYAPVGRQDAFSGRFGPFRVVFHTRGRQTASTGFLDRRVPEPGRVPPMMSGGPCGGPVDDPAQVVSSISCSVAPARWLSAPPRSDDRQCPRLIGERGHCNVKA